jgi:hypothetical protein
MKKLMLGIFAVLLLTGSFLAADWNGWWGYVYLGDNTVEDAMVIIKKVGEQDADTVYTDENGRYEKPCISGYYDLTAKKIGYVDIDLNQYQGGGVGGTQHNFHLELPNK